ncbi:hypothetical protein GCM10009114_11800 [Aliiglaciecola litoralis]|uniref:Uncharacterized protein n=1 Tax=Aliiglaciecola litoralis TaxID=582857 RepID=A0ABP3WUH5_9ALTE
MGDVGHDGVRVLQQVSQSWKAQLTLRTSFLIETSVQGMRNFDSPTSTKRHDNWLAESVGKWHKLTTHSRSYC